MNQSRELLRHQWLKAHALRYGLDVSSEAPASADASFRSYWRVSAADNRTYIVMDAPPSHEDVRPFVAVDALMHEAGLNAPTIYEQDPEQGFLLLSDLGQQTFLDVIDESNAREMMDQATDALIRWQSISREGVLPVYDRAMLKRELDLFPQWYIGTHRNKTLDERQQHILKVIFERILADNLSQPQVFVHRDFMPRNLMVGENEPGILDFQDAVYGPITYDIASLTRDAFVSWTEPFVIDTTIRYWEKARKAGLPVSADFGEFWRHVEWMGLQRHLKVLGIFARINYRDGKPKYLADTPRFITYVRETANRYDELKGLLYLIDQIEETVPQYGYTF